MHDTNEAWDTRRARFSLKQSKTRVYGGGVGGKGGGGGDVGGGV